MVAGDPYYEDFDDSPGVRILASTAAMRAFRENHRALEQQRRQSRAVRQTWTPGSSPKKPGRIKKPEARKRYRLWLRWPHCTYCHEPIVFVKSTLDHVVPKSRGGTEVVLACKRCNTDKADMPLTVWQYWVAFETDLYQSLSDTPARSSGG